MKKFLAAICAATLLLTGCTSETGDRPANNFSGKVVRLGMLPGMNITEGKMGETLNMIEEKSGVKDTRSLPKFYDNLRLMQMGIESGQIDQISLYKSVADYLVKSNDKFEVVQDNALAKIEYVFCFAVRKDETTLRNNLNKAIDEMKKDGTLDKMVNDYITNVDAHNIPTVEIPEIEGAPTIKFGITGDLPPLDLILPNNSPAGFNTAMLAEIANRLRINIEIVQIETGARAAALTSNLIDVVFWAVVPFGNSDIPSDLDKPAGIELSNPYFKDNVAHIQLKGNK